MCVLITVIQQKYLSAHLFDSDPVFPPGTQDGVLNQPSIFPHTRQIVEKSGIGPNQLYLNFIIFTNNCHLLQ